MSERGASWYVKTDDGNEYGPVALDKLIGWARDGRIEPTSEISSDRIKWSPAPLLPDLGMRWIVETEFGRYFGPFHPDLVKELFDKKRVPPASRTFCLNDGADAAAYRKSQEELSAARCDLASAADREKELQGELAATKADLERLRAKAAKDISELRNEAQAREAELASSLAAAEAATKSLQKSAEESANAAAEKIAALESSLAEATAANAEWVERDEKRNQAMKAAEKELAESRKAQAAAEQRLEDAQRKLERFAKKGGGLFSGKSASDLAALELAARRELAAAKRRPFGGAFGGRREPVAAIDVDAKEL